MTRLSDTEAPPAPEPCSCDEALALRAELRHVATMVRSVLVHPDQLPTSGLRSWLATHDARRTR